MCELEAVFNKTAESLVTDSIKNQTRLKNRKENYVFRVVRLQGSSLFIIKEGGTKAILPLNDFFLFCFEIDE